MEKDLPKDNATWEKEVPYLFAGLTIVIEYLAGGTRTKVNKEGASITGTMPAAYGRILGTTDAHGEEIDVYLASNPDPTAPVFIIDQVDPSTSVFDEHKVMLGFGTIAKATAIYKSVFSDGSGVKRLGAVTILSIDQFKTWLGTEGSSLKPAADFYQYNKAVKIFAGVKNCTSLKDSPVSRDAAGGVYITLPDVSQGPKIVTKSTQEGVYDYHLYLYSALDTKTWSNVIDTTCRLLDFASDKDTLHTHISSPGGSVILMGRIVSAMARTKAKVITYAEGSVASAATTIWSAGHIRHILPGAYFMQHMSSQMLGGKTNDIQAKSLFCMNYIKMVLDDFVRIGLFTQQEIDDMADRGSDIFISGREAIARVGAISLPDGTGGL